MTQVEKIMAMMRIQEEQKRQEHKQLKGLSVCNQLVQCFSQEIQHKRKRRFLRTFDHCFSGIEVIEWLKTYIDVNQQSSRREITEADIRWLLERLLQCGLLICVWGKSWRRGRKFGSQKNLYTLSTVVP